MKWVADTVGMGWDLCASEPDEIETYGWVQLMKTGAYRACMLVGYEQSTYHLTLEEAQEDLIRQATVWRLNRGGTDVRETG